MSRLRLRRRYDETPVVELQRSNPVRFGIVLLVIVAVAVYFGFTKHIPFKHGFRLKAVFSTAVNIRPKSPVRIAGVNVGKVSSIARDGNVGVVSMEIESKGLPIHCRRDAEDQAADVPGRQLVHRTAARQPIGARRSPRVRRSRSRRPPTRSSSTRCSDALNTETRANLQNFLQGYGDGLTRKPNAAENAEQDPEVRGLNAAQALNKSYHRGPAALRGNAIVNQAVTGTEAHDLSGLIASIGKVTAALNVHEQQLSEWVPNFNAFFHTFAAQAPSLSATIARPAGGAAQRQSRAWLHSTRRSRRSRALRRPSSRA